MSRRSSGVWVEFEGTLEGRGEGEDHLVDHLLVGGFFFLHVTLYTRPSWRYFFSFSFFSFLFFSFSSLFFIYLHVLERVLG